MEPSVLTRALAMEGSDFLTYHLGDLRPACQGGVVEFSLTLRDIRPDRRVAVAISLCGAAQDALPQCLGTKTFTVPPHHGDAPRDLEVEGVRFILPEDLAACHDGARRLEVQAECHYIDRNECCRLPEPAGEA